MNKKLKCAIYTRKSTEEGLDQDYNSLDAQRDAGEAYIKSQQHEGWIVVRERYDDPGFSGGNIERPGLQALITDIKAGKINVVVVYKIDRLTRSLTDFAKLVEIFDEYGVTFVSVTQSFNTTTSMGRLTLNVLLSFAQFEREVTGERIRDKFSSSMKKGIWMGGFLILGYDLDSRKLIINEEEAKDVRFVFETYLQLDSTYELLALMREREIKTKSWVTRSGKKKQGKYYSPSTIYTMLRNPLYAGKLRHKGKIYDGEHEAIIDDDLWQKVQEKLDSRTTEPNRHKNKVKPFLLRAKVFDPSGNKLSTTYSVKSDKGQKSYIRYYINKTATVYGYDEKTLRYINADELENLAYNLLGQTITQHKKLHENWHSIVLGQRDQFIQDTIQRINISQNKIEMQLCNKAIDKIIEAYKTQSIQFEKRDVPIKSLENLAITKGDETTICSMVYSYKNYGGRKIITDKSGSEVSIIQTQKNTGLITALVTASRSHKLLSEGTCKSIVDLANHHKRDRSYISKILKLHYLSPKIKELILDGKQPRSLTLQSLLKIADHINWLKQEALLNL